MTTRLQALYADAARNRLAQYADWCTPCTPPSDSRRWYRVTSETSTAVAPATTPVPPRSMLDKIWDSHVVFQGAGEPAILYIDMHYVHEVTSPQAFDGLRLTGRRVRRRSEPSPLARALLRR